MLASVARPLRGLALLSLAACRPATPSAASVRAVPDSVENPERATASAPVSVPSASTPPTPPGSVAAPSASSAAPATGGTRAGAPGSEAFAGVWRVDQPGHALYEASFYELRADGTMTYMEALSDDRHRPVGHVASQVGGRVVCSFGSRWRPISATTLGITGDCSDAQPREIVLEVARPSPGYVGAVEVKLVSVGGERRWKHDGWFWEFARCDSAGRCGGP